MNRIFASVPRNVLISIAALLVALVSFVILSLTLGAARDAAIIANQRLSAQIQQATTSIISASADRDYVAANIETYETLLKSDRLIPHTRRAAVLRLQDAARVHGLSALNWTFNAASDTSPQAALAQPSSAAYRLSVEEIALKVGSHSDGPIYAFVSDVTKSFPGSAIVQSVVLKRAPQITDAALRAVSEGRDSALVEGEVRLIWRTAQAQDPSEQGAKK
jgi:hypothetical protein